MHRPEDNPPERFEPATTSAVDAALVDAGRALATGDPLRALGLAGRIDGALALTVRGVAYAQLGDLELARQSLGRAMAVSRDPRTLARARAALVEIALCMGDPAAAARDARNSAAELEALGDVRNASMQRLVQARAEVLLGRLGEARRVVDEVLSVERAPHVHAVASLAQAEIAIRALAAHAARDALGRARRALTRAPHPLLARAIQAVERELSIPVARLVRAGASSSADLFAIEKGCRGDVLLVDACRRLVTAGRATIPLARRPVLFALMFALARAWPEAIARDVLISRAFDVRKVNPSHRARLRVEIGRLRKALDGLDAEPIATANGYELASQRSVVLLLPLSDDETARIALLLGDGASWSAQGLAEHTGTSRRTAQRALATLVQGGGAIRTGRGRTVRYSRPGVPIASRMLLLGLLGKN